MNGDTQAKLKKKVLVTGASGLIGGLVLEGLGHKYELSALNRRKVESVFYSSYSTETDSRTGELADWGLTSVALNCTQRPSLDRLPSGIPDSV